MLVLSVLLSVVALLLAVMYVQFRWRHRLVIAAANKLPCPPALPLLGNLLFFVGGVTSSFTKNMVLLTNKFKPLFCLWLGPVPIFVVCDPSDVQIVLNNSNTLEKDELYTSLKPIFGNGILTAPVHIWKKYRRIMTPILHPTNVEKFLPIFNEVSRQLVTNLSTAGKTVDPKKMMYNAALDAITHDVTYSPFDEGWLWREKYVDWNDEVNRRTSLPASPLSHKSERTVDKDMVDLCLLHPDDDQEDHKWRHEFRTMIAAGTETVVSTLKFLLITLANNANAQDKVYEEIREVLGDSDRDLTLRDVNALKYLEHAIMESMRIHGTIPLITRQATKDTKLSNSVLPAGSRILVPLYAMGWDAELFPQPEKFIPERFCTEYQDEAQAKRHSYAFLPFSRGPRNCIGKTYAMHFMKVVAVHILRKYKLKTQISLEDIVYELRVVMLSKSPLLLDLEPRTDAVV